MHADDSTEYTDRMRCDHSVRDTQTCDVLAEMAAVWRALANYVANHITD
jgi:hypothetical protein